MVRFLDSQVRIDYSELILVVISPKMIHITSKNIVLKHDTLDQSTHPCLKMKCDCLVTLELSS